MTVHIEFAVPGRDEAIKRTWPVALPVGARIFLEELIAEVEVKEIVFGAVFDGPLVVSGSCTVYARCDHVEDSSTRVDDLGPPPMSALERAANAVLADAEELAGNDQIGTVRQVTLGALKAALEERDP